MSVSSNVRIGDAIQVQSVARNVSVAADVMSSEVYSSELSTQWIYANFAFAHFSCAYCDTKSKSVSNSETCNFSFRLCNCFPSSWTRNAAMQ